MKYFPVERWLSRDFFGLTRLKSCIEAKKVARRGLRGY